MKAQVDENLCIGCELCEEICPEVFHIVEGIATVIVDPVPLNIEDKCRKALEDCPTEAIAVEE